MFGLKDAYFYLVAVQISIIKFFKKIYFGTDYYHKSLISKVPVQVFFNPNPFLLSIISPFRGKSFKINEINPNDFWLEDKNKDALKNHNFLWLNLIDRKVDGKNIQKIIYLWMLKNSKFKRGVWESSVLSSRIISWILNIDIIINNGTFEFKKNFFKNIIYQCNHLKKNVGFEKNQLKKIQVLSALILSGLTFKEYEENFNIGIKELEKFIKNFFDEDGFPHTRNPNDLVFFTKYLILCHESIKDAQQYVPEFLDEMVRKNLNCIRFIKSPDNHSPLFNGSSKKNLNQFDKFIEKFKANKNEKKNVIGGLFKAKSRTQAIFFDIESPPNKSFSKNYQAGPLSFEYFVDGIKVVTNSGFGEYISAKAELISRHTASQSTLTINDTSIVKFEKNRLINSIYGNSIKSTFKTIDLKIKDEKNLIGCSIAHTGYDKKFNCIHKREVTLDQKNNKLIGHDHILKKRDGLPIRYVLRFHLNPALSAVKTISGNSALIQISKSKSLIFTIKNESLELEKSIYLAGEKILENTCITISGNLVNKDKSFNWEIKKEI